MIADVAENGFELLVTIGARKTDHLHTQVYRHSLLLRLGLITEKRQILSQG
jgi:hypothetical protein